MEGPVILISNAPPEGPILTDAGYTLKGRPGGLAVAMVPFLERTLCRGQKRWMFTNPLPVDDLGDSGVRAMENLYRSASNGIEYNPFFFTKEQMHNHYEGYSNGVLWGMFHSMPEEFEYHKMNSHELDIYWSGYKEVNRVFAERAADMTGENERIFVQDYHFLLFAEEYRKIKPNQKIDFFLHIPFPTLDILQQMDQSQIKTIIKGMMQFDMVGFHTRKDSDNFISAVQHYMKDEIIDSPEEYEDLPNVRFIQNGERRVKVGNFLIGIDPTQHEMPHETPDVLMYKNRTLANYSGKAFENRITTFGRAELSKNEPNMIAAFGLLVDEHREIAKELAVYMNTAPSRLGVPVYAKYYEQIQVDTQKLQLKSEEKIGHRFIELNKEGVPREYVNTLLSLTGIYLAAPKADGYNLTVAESLMVNPDTVAVVSERAGVYQSLEKAVIPVNPYDVRSIAQGIIEAYKMDIQERRRLNAIAREIITSSNNIDTWREQINKASSAR